MTCYDYFWRKNCKYIKIYGEDSTTSTQYSYHDEPIIIEIWSDG